MAITEAMIESLRGSLKSSNVITPHDEGYTQSLKRWSEYAEKNAGIVVLPTTAEDVSTTVIFATSNGLEIAVCGGGHSTSGSSSSDGGVVIDLSKMRNVIVKPEEMCIIAQGGCLWEDVDVEAGKYDLATVGGTVNHTGIGGLTLGGGYGWLSGKYGLVIDNLLSVQVVLADGQIVMASETENQDLFWAMRGAGQSFGVATEFTFRAHSQPNSVWAGILMFTTENLDAVLEFTNTIPDASEDGNNGIILGLAAPPTLEGAIAILALVYHNGSASSGERYYKPLLDLEPVLNTVAEMPYSQLNGLTKYFATHGDRKITNGVAFITPLSPAFVRELIDEFTAFLAKIPEAARSIILMECHDQRKICKISHTATAFANRGMYQNVVICPRWTSTENDAICRAWAKAMGTKYENEKIRMENEGHSVDVEGAGRYGNYDGFGSSAKKIFGPNYEKLVVLKTKYDPSNVFNKNIELVPAKAPRGPSVLVTDSRERPSISRTNTALQRPSTSGAGAARRTPTRFISVDNVLQYASEIPSGQARGPPGRKPPATNQRRGSIPSIGARVAQQNVPGRSTKTSEKLVLIPETVNEKEDSDDDDNDADELGKKLVEDEEGPLKDTEIDILKKRGGIRGKSAAERLPKAKRTERLARVTAYCTAEGYKTKATATFVKDRHGAKTKLYDDCLYTVYHLPLLPGTEGFRVRSSPILKSPGGKAVLDEEIERSERRNYHDGYFEDTDTYGVRGGEGSPRNEPEELRSRREDEERRDREESQMEAHSQRPDSPNRIGPDATTFAEMFVFSYGVVVFWNFTERQEKDILADFTFSEINTGISVVARPQDESDFEMEELHFEYSPLVERPRIFNDMITLRSGDHMIKLAMSHAIAQSTKLSFFEEKMSRTMLDAQYVPKRLALTGTLGMGRTEIVKILGRLFKSRVDVNLSSNILDVPNFFWDSEPTLHPLYFAIREYLEISPRIKVLNERCRVFLDLAEILSDSIADYKMSMITYIIIVLIIISIVVTMTEVVLRFTILEKGKENNGRIGNNLNMPRNWTRLDFEPPQLEAICGNEIVGKTFADLCNTQIRTFSSM